MKTTTFLCVRDTDYLFRPFNDRKLALNTRIVMAPMIRNLAPDGIPTAEMEVYYRRRAEKDVGLIITGSVSVDDEAAADDTCMPRFFGGAALRAWKKICRAVHATDCKIIPQLSHAGMMRPLTGDLPNPDVLPIGPSGINPLSLKHTCEPMSRRRIADVCDSFARAAAMARLLGFDGVEIQGGEGYLIDQFLWSETNKRRDEYGGDIVGRTRFACEVIHAVRKSVGRQFPVIFRFSQWKTGNPAARLVESPHELSELLMPLCEAGVDMFDCAESLHAEPAFPGNALSLAAWVRLLTQKKVICGGGSHDIRTHTEMHPRAMIQHMVRLLQSKEVDLVAVGQSLLADAAWAEKIRYARESEIIPFTLRTLSRLY